MRGDRPLNISRGIIAVALLTTLAACNSSTALDFAALTGVWIADAIVYTDNANPGTTVDVLVRDGASWQMSIQNDGGTAVTFDDGLGNVRSFGGRFLADEGVVILDDEEYIVVRVSNRMTFTNANQMFQFDPSAGPVSATIRVEVGRL